MDYSASIHETEDPAASPWGNTPGSSPQHDRTSFASLTGDAPVPAFPYTPQPSNGDDVFPQSGSITPTAGGEGDFGDAGVAAAAASETETVSQTAESEAAQSTASTEAPSEEPQQQPRKPPQPQFRLQAKITGLERTGKKDPILRFDVHVSLGHAVSLQRMGLNLTVSPLIDKPASIPHHPVPRCPTSAFRIRQAGRAFDICQPRSPSSRCSSPDHVCWRRYRGGRESRQGSDAAMVQLRLRQRGSDEGRRDGALCGKRLWL